eukprot:582465-Rhodomonas_salina.5
MHLSVWCVGGKQGAVKTQARAAAMTGRTRRSCGQLRPRPEARALLEQAAAPNSTAQGSMKLQGAAATGTGVCHEH